MAKITQKQFIERAIIVHGDGYLYDEVDYIKSSVKIIINCREHGAFEQTPNSHLSGAGCPSCSGNRKKNTADFIRNAISVHGNKYDYSKTEYSGNHKKVTITCIRHGVDFEQEAKSHLSGCGCKLCGIESSNMNSSIGYDEFVIRSIDKHGMKYSYHKATYINVKEKVLITCKLHGDFWKTPDKHMRGQGCPSCSKFGFDQTKMATVYFLIGDNGIKVGVTNNLKQRMSQLSRYTPFQFDMIRNVITKGTEAMRLEKYFHNKYESAGLTGFDGATEWLKYSKPLMDEIMK